jgi:hypothetical protein
VNAHGAATAGGLGLWRTLDMNQRGSAAWRAAAFIHLCDFGCAGHVQGSCVKSIFVPANFLFSCNVAARYCLMLCCMLLPAGLQLA